MSETVWKPRVYLAGKIAKNDWRGTIFPGVRDVTYEEWPNPTWPIENDRFIYSGPLFRSCDHGCFHGRSQHGVGASEPGCADITTPRLEVALRCARWICASDVIFAWLDNSDAYGTIAELGYAKAHNKPVYLAFSTALPDETVDAHWFIATMAQGTVRTHDAGAAWERFERWWRLVEPDYRRKAMLEVAGRQPFPSASLYRERIERLTDTLGKASQGFAQIMRWTSDPRARDEAARQLRVMQQTQAQVTQVTTQHR